MARHHKKLTHFRKTHLAALLVPLLSAAPVYANNPVSVTDGSTLTLSGTYNNSAAYAPVLTVDGTGSTIKAGADVTIQSSTGYSATTIKVTNGGTLDFTGVTLDDINTTVTDQPLLESNGGNVYLTGGKINSNAVNEYLLNFHGNSTAVIDGTEFNVASGTFTRRVILADESDITLNNSVMNIEANRSTALQAHSAVIRGQNNKITTNGMYGIYASGNASVIDLKNTELTVDGSYHAIFVESADSNLNFDNLTLSGSLGSSNSHYAFVSHTSSVNNVTTFSNSSLHLTKGGGYYFTKGTLNLDHVDTTMDSGVGLILFSSAASNINDSLFDTAGVAIDNRGTLKVERSKIMATDNAANAINNSGTATFADSELISNGNYTSTLYAQGGSTTNLDNVGITNNGSNGFLINVLSNAKVTGNRVNAVATEQNTHGLRIYYGSNSVDLTDSAITVKGADANGINVSNTTMGENIILNNSTIVSEQGYGMHVDGSIVDLELKNGAGLSGGNGYLIYAKDSSGIFSKVNASADNGVTLIGDIAADAGNEVSLRLDNNSHWKGSTTQATTVGVGQDSAWQMTDNSRVENLAMSNEGRVIFMGTGTPYQRLETAHLTGNGHFVMRTGIVEDTGDRLSVSGTSAGDHQLSVLNNGSRAADGSEVLTVVDTLDGVAQFSLANEVELGGYLFGLRQNGTDWELYSTGRRSSTSNASVNMLVGGYLLGYAENQTLLQRMGQLRTERGDGNFWLRGYGGGFNSFGSQALEGFTMSYAGTQMGVDKQWQYESGTGYFGLMAGLSDASQRFERGHGNAKNHHFGLYAGYLDNDGLYIDAVLKYNRLRNNINVSDSAGDDVNGKATSNGYAFSIESGQRFYFTAENRGAYLEPQVQLTFSRQNSSRFDNSNGLTVDLSGYNSTLGRFGGIIGYDVQDSPTPINFYFKTAYLREFSAKADYSLNGSQESHSFKGDWWLNGVGASVEVAKKHNIYLDMEKVNGNQFNQHQLNVGYRVNF